MASRICIRPLALQPQIIARTLYPVRSFGTSTAPREREKKSRRSLSRATGPIDLKKLQHQTDNISRWNEKEYARLWKSMHAKEHDGGDNAGARATTKRLQADIAYIHADQRFNEASMAWISLGNRTVLRDGKPNAKYVLEDKNTLQKFADTTRAVRDAGLLCRRTKWDSFLPTLLSPSSEVAILQRLGRFITVFVVVSFHSAAILGAGTMLGVTKVADRKLREKDHSDS